MQNENKKINFIKPETILEGDIVWIYEGHELIGPFFVDHYGLVGYGSNSRLLYKLLDTSSGAWHSSERKWIRVPEEVACN